MIKKIIFYILSVIISFIIGWYFHKPEQIVKTVEVIKNIDHVVYRDYQSVNNDVCISILKKYDQTPFHQTFIVKELNSTYTDVSLHWDLYERNGEQEIRVPVYQSGNFKFYAGLGLGAVAVGGVSYGLFKILK